MDDEGLSFRDLPEYHDVQRALEALGKRCTGEGVMLLDFVTVAVFIPSDENPDWSGKYMFWDSSPFPHITDGLIERGKIYNSRENDNG